MIALITGLVCKGMMDRALKHLEETQTIGGTPRDVYQQRAELEAEKRRQNLEARKPQRVRRHGVID